MNFLKEQLNNCSKAKIKNIRRRHRRRKENGRTQYEQKPTTKKQNVIVMEIPSGTVTMDDAGPVLELLDLSFHLRVSILNYLGETQEELINLILVSKTLYEDCKRPGIEWKIISTIEINPTQGVSQGVGQRRSIHELVQQLCNHLLDNKTDRKLQRYTHMRVNDIHKFDAFSSWEEIQRITNNLRMDRILSLDMSSLSFASVSDCSLPYVLPHILPKLLEINISNKGIGSAVLAKFSNYCTRIEKITWNDINLQYSYVDLDGSDMCSAENLKEIIMDDSEFFCWTDQDHMSSNIENHRDTFIFHYCSKALERVSIRNAKWHLSMNNNNNNNNVNPVPQNALIKFVRNVPISMRWFRSDLTQENMAMLRLERPEIELLN
ncbi:MAG: hypothetical protein ACI8RD_006903 [Bacillariaceae sp.]|jgi:hypothetical protein